MAPLLILRDLGIGVDGNDPEGERPITDGRLPYPGEIEEIPVVEFHPEALFTDPHLKF